MSLKKLLGVDTLKGKTDDVSIANIEGKVTLLYFSAHWCPPCKGFTPELAKFYEHLKGKNVDFEVIFCSSDRSEEEFNGYFQEMPWLALPYAERKAKDKLSRKFKVSGIPSLVVLDEDANVITKEGRTEVMGDKQGEKFPWKPKSIYELLEEAPITTKNGDKLSVSDLKEMDSFALYFSAHWCPPCRAFTPKLISVYHKLKSRTSTKKFAFIYCSSDNSENEFKEYYAEMPWATVAFKHESIKLLAKTVGVEGIPTLVTISGETGKMINVDARSSAADDPEGMEYPWHPKSLAAVNPLEPSNEVIEALNQDICIVLATNNTANKETPIAEFTKGAEKYDSEVNSKNNDKVLFFLADEAHAGLLQNIMGVVGTQAPSAGKAFVLAFNLTNKGSKEVLSAENISADKVFNLATSFAKSQQE